MRLWRRVGSVEGMVFEGEALEGISSVDCEAAVVGGFKVGIVRPGLPGFAHL